MKRKITKQKQSKTIIVIIVLVCIIASIIAWQFIKTTNEEKPMNTENKNVITIKTSKGNIVVELFPDKTPQTVANFQQYVEEEFYNNTVFHRVIENFMIQGGGFTKDGVEKKTRESIILEAKESNLRGTIAMARTNAPNSATSQFFINHVDNLFLNPAPGNPGYTVFGKVIAGMDVVDTIAQVQTKRTPMADWPVDDVIIYEIVFGN